MDNNYSIISLSEQESVTLAIISLVNRFPDLPLAVKSRGVSYYDMFPNFECMGIAPQGSAIVEKKFIGMSYIGMIKFRLQYRYSTSNSSERIQKQSIISTIGEWLSRKTITRPDGTNYKLDEYPDISENINILSIDAVNRTILVDKSLSGYEDSILDLILKYHVGAN